MRARARAAEFPVMQSVLVLIRGRKFRRIVAPLRESSGRDSFHAGESYLFEFLDLFDAFRERVSVTSVESLGAVGRATRKDFAQGRREDRMRVKVIRTGPTREKW